MNPVFPSRKQADEFDLALSRSLADGGSDATGRHDELLDLVTALRRSTPPSPRADFSADLRARLMEAATTVLAPDTEEQRAARLTPAVRRSPRERRIAAAVGGFAIVSATASMAVAAQSALPGDTLYPLKRAIENAQTGVQRDADGRGTTLLGNAAGRLDEVGALSRSGDDDGAISTTLQDFVDQANQASELLLSDYSSTGHASSIEELRSFTAESMGALTSLQSVIPREARASLIEATQVITAIDVQAQSLCPACTDLPIMQAPAFAATTIDTLLDDALGTDLAPAAGATGTGAGTGTAAKGAGDGASKRHHASGQAEAPAAAPTPALPPAAPAQPTLPQHDPAAGGGTSKGHTGPGLLDHLNVSGSEDPLGDLLTGTGDVVDGTVDGVVDGLTGGLSDGLGGLTGN